VGGNTSAGFGEDAETTLEGLSLFRTDFKGGAGVVDTLLGLTEKNLQVVRRNGMIGWIEGVLVGT